MTTGINFQDFQELNNSFDSDFQSDQNQRGNNIHDITYIPDNNLINKKRKRDLEPNSNMIIVNKDKFDLVKKNLCPKMPVIFIRFY